MESVAVCSGAVGGGHRVRRTCAPACAAFSVCGGLPCARRFAGGTVEVLLWTPAARRGPGVCFSSAARIAARGLLAEGLPLLLGAERDHSRRILLIIGFVANVAVIWTIGIFVVVAGAILALLGMTGHAVRGRRHYY
jgi:Family of unknown function (DUF6131)